MKFGLLTNPRLEIVEEIKSIFSHGFDYVEIGIEWPEGSVDKLNKKSKQIKKILDEKNSFAVGHTAWWMDFGNPYDEVRRAWIKECFKKILVAKKLGIRIINFHFQSRELERIEFYLKYKKEILNNLVESFNKLVSFGERNGLEVMLENVPDNKSSVGFQDYFYVVNKVPKIKVHLDVAHAYISGGMSMIKKYITTLQNRIVHLHLHDNHGQFDEHLPIGDGTIDYRRVLRWLKQINFNRTATFEVFTSKEDAKNSMLKIKKLWKKN